MEDALKDEVNTTVMPISLKSVEVEVNEEPKINSDKEDSKIVKVNGDTQVDNSDGTESSDYDNLVIDEKPLNNRKRKLLPFSPESGFKGFKRVKNEDEQYEPPTNPYFNESLFELSELHNNKNTHSLEKSVNSEEKNNTSSTSTNVNQVDEIGTNSSAAPTTIQIKKILGKKKKAGSPKLREYAQYLGLQPTVQFKCSRCALRGFSSLPLLNEHQLECTGEGLISPPAETQTTAPSTNFRVTRKVYLCSACGTYYENWNLFLHMREIHKRFICLYCLGMFSHPEKLSLHLVSKHNCVPSQLNSEEDFFHVYKEPCFLMCCECEKVFSERDNFFGHECGGKTNKNGTDNKSKNNISNTNANNQRQLISQKNKVTKQTKNSVTFVEHVTAETTVEDKGSEMTEESQETIYKEETKAEEMQVIDKEEANECNNKAETNVIDQVTMETDNLETNDENQDTQVDVSKKYSPEKSDGDLKQEECESEVEDIPESPRYESESPVTQEEADVNEVDNEDTNKESDVTKSESEQSETRKVPKVTLKLPKNTTPYVDHDDSDDSDKLTMECDSVDAKVEVKVEDNVHEEKENVDPLVNVDSTMDVAGSEIPIIELELEHPLDKFDIQLLLQKCLKETIANCVYCNHARKIAVNGKQLGLHAIAEHRFSAIVNSITAEELIPESFVMRIKEGLPELQNLYFNLDTSPVKYGSDMPLVFECFQCRYATNVHKELYLHNRKMHAKTILLCIMCKSNFYSYSELVCHLCPGLYELNNDINFRCCMCACDDLPSAFRLMVHLRKRHHACDVCLELCHNQSRLSNHVWKHKLHHLCYRCGIAYRNKPDITKHLFWKHGTESVLCKKCLQKKWPHVYHFCIPPSTFTCEECNLNFTKAVALKVHKRIHRDERPHTCTFENCNEKFVSKKLLLKHEFKHREQPEDKSDKNDKNKDQEFEGAPIESRDEKPDDTIKDENSNEAAEKKPKPRVDVYDLPELNLSESDSSDTDEEVVKEEKDAVDEVPKLDVPEQVDKIVENGSAHLNANDLPVTSNESSAPVLENIWDDFKLYQASKDKEKIENVEKSEEETESEIPSALEVPEEKPELNQAEIVDIIMRDHDYSLLSQEYKTESKIQQSPQARSMDHDYCSSNNTAQQEEISTKVTVPPPVPSPEKKEVKRGSASDSSNDSDSSSCTCASNCSCSGSSGSSSSSSDSSDSDSSTSEGRRRQQARRERRQRAKVKKENDTSPIDVVATDNQAPAQVDLHIEETDLDTTETETDEDFYDKQPQKLASKLIAEKRKELMLLAGIGTLANGAVLESSRPSTPSLPEIEATKVKKKSKNKKKKKKRKQEKQMDSTDNPSTSYQYQLPIVSPLTISLAKNSPLGSPNHSAQFAGNSSVDDQMLGLNSDISAMSDSSLRASKRRRIPNKFYGYSSDEETAEKHLPPVLKWRKADLPSPARPTPNSPMVVPPITIKTLPPISQEDATPNRSINLNEMRMHQQQQLGFTPQNFPNNARIQEDSGSESNESSSEEEPPQPPPLLNKPPNQPPLYCYCRCPYDEVSEMIGCDSDDCLIEWFHFECVGIMVPPKGQWFCPDCRKKKQQRKELALT